MNELIKKIFVGLTIVIICLTANAQTVLQLGELSYSRASAPHLRRAVSITPGFFRAVGGVAFNAVAQGRDGYIVTSIVYDPEGEDGQRLKVTIKKPDEKQRTFEMGIYDWQLVPIANFSTSDEGAAMTLFGALEDQEFADEITRNSGRVINYHETLDNTLLGLRLMQADIVLFDRNAIDLPKEGENYVLGAGESAPDVEQNGSAFDTVANYIDGKRYSSYVVGDLNVSVEFGVIGSEFKFFGSPSWTMWKNPDDFTQAVELMTLLEQAQGEDDSLESYLALSKLSDMYETREEIQSAIERANRVLERYENIDRGNWPVEFDEELSTTVSEYMERENGINPIVYGAVKNVMYYRALFKHYQNVNPGGYQKFISSLSSVVVEPNVITPTVQRNERFH